MDILGLLFRGLLVGLAIAIPVGPVNVLCISRTVSKGWRAGVVSGIGAATADALYGAVAAFSITFVIQFLTVEQFWIRVVGGLLLVALGITYLLGDPMAMPGKNGQSEGSAYVSTFMLGLTNPTTVLSFMAVMAVLGLGQQRAGWVTLLVVGAIFAGSMAWWLTLASIVTRFRSRIGPRSLLWMNRVAGIAIGGFGLVSFFLARRHPG
jgi:threonine/homoserine/homoserine lactone efflux protein